MTSSYLALGKIVADQRAKAGIATQDELASLLGVSQQTVSRWEAGQSRPRVNQIPKLAQALKASPDDLLEAAGYAAKKATISFDVPFPVDALSPESFERFTADLIQALHPAAKVMRFGGQGHDQAGIDVLADMPEGERHTFQCKRVAEFGPQKVRDVVAKQTFPANRKFLLLTRTASPDARAAIDPYNEWELWDRDDISRKVRQLPVEEQKRLVRIYFPGQELALLGVSPASPWETVEEFYAVYTREKALFNHTWQVVGREGVIEKTFDALRNPNVGMVLITGSGGGGKSRILREVLIQLEAEEPARKIRLASQTMDITKASLDELGRSDLLLVVDDAHDRDDLQVLFNYAAAEAPRVKLLLASRRYGVDHIKAQAGRYSISGDHLAQIDVPPLSPEDAEALARQVLERLGGPVAVAKDIARLTYDCPLATVVGAQVVAQNGIHPGFVRNEERFRETLISKFQEVIAGHLGDRENPEEIKRLLGFLALIQPFSIDDERLLAALEAVEQVRVADSQRMLRLLIEAGIVFQRGSKYRLSPDVLGDYVIESRFEGPDGCSNGLAEQYFDLVPKDYLEHLLLNLGRIDWRRAGTTSAEGPLLDGVWAKLKPQDEYSDPHIRAVRAVAYYQPRRALAFVEGLIRKGRFLRQLSDIAKYAAYTEEYTEQALECLWELGRQDERDTNPEPSHPIRILTEFAEPQPGKPISFNEAILTFGLKLAKRPDVWKGRYTPFDILDGILKTEGHTNSYERHTISMTPFFVAPDRVAPLREKVIALLVTSLSDADPHKAVRAARSLGNALRHPHGLLGARVEQRLHKRWDAEFAMTLNKVKDALEATQIAPLVQAEINRTVGWHAIHGSPALRKIARQVQAAISSDLDTRVHKVLTDGYGMEDRRADREGHPERWASFLDKMVTDLTRAYPVSEARLAAIEEKLELLEAGGLNRAATPEVLVGRMIDQSPGFAEAIIANALKSSDSRISRFVGHALGKVLRGDRAEGRKHIASFLTSGREDLLAAVGIAYQSQKFDRTWVVEQDIGFLTQVLTSPYEWVILCGLRAVRYLAEWDSEVALALVRIISIPTSRVADEVATLFEYGDFLKLSGLSREDALSLLDRFEHLPELDGHWLDKILADFSELYPWECARFFMRRVELASQEDGPDMRPCNYGPWAHERLRIRQTPECFGIMREVAHWMRRNHDRKGMFGYYSRALFETMFAPYDATIVGFLEEWLSAATAEDMHVIASIVREADRGFVFTQRDFVMSLLERARQMGPDVHRMVSSELYCSAISGLRQGAAGEPFPEDLALKAKTEEVLANISRFSAAFELYDWLRQHAEREIKRALQEREEFE